MTIENKIYAKEQQIKLLNNLLYSLCSTELNSDGRIHLKKIKEKIKTELVDLRFRKALNNKREVVKPNGHKPTFSEVIKNLW